MRIVFSRKGFDSASGGGPSPIVNERPVSLPIPTSGEPHETYGALGLGDHAAVASRGRLGPQSACHHDPMFLAEGTCLFGQCGAAQTHLANRGVGVGDVFLFFGLFARAGEKPHHRIFGYLQIEEVIALDRCPAEQRAWLKAQRHPHALTPYARNDTIYRGPGRTARRASPALRLTAEGAPVSLWQRPGWLRPGELSYHHRPDRWLPGRRLKTVGRGQEFVADVGRRKAPRDWLRAIMREIED